MKPDPEEALRYVTLAAWNEGQQGQSGYYAVQLNCGHTLRCSPPMLSARMVCMDCMREIVGPGMP